MFKPLFTILSVLFLCITSSSQLHSTNGFSPDLDVANIPLPLLENATAVVRFEKSTYTLASIGKLTIDFEKAVTILSEKGSGAGNVSIYYQEKAEKVKDLKIEIYDAQGALITKIKKKQIQDVSAYDGFSIANDARLKVYEHTSNQYPITIKYSYKKTSKNTMGPFLWFPQDAFGLSTQSSVFKVVNKSGVILMSKAYNLDTESIDIDEENYTFIAKDLLAIKKEKQAPNFLTYAPYVRVLPVDFEYYGEKGRFSDWKSYGKWVYDKMLTGRNDLPEELINSVSSMIPSGATDLEKAAIVYDYVTNSTRYVSVQLGVGGLMPFKCSDVYDLKYGDCKALSFYTANLLEKVGVDAIYTEINSNRQYARSYDESLPGAGQGNHIVLCLPSSGDTSWLECTTNGLLFNYTHSGINQRRALLIKPDGGELVMTDGYSAEENKKLFKARLEIIEDNVADIKINNEYFNYRYENMRSQYHETKTKRKKFIKSYYYDNLPSLEIVKYELDVDSTQIMMREEAHFQSKNLIETAGNYKLIPLNISNLSPPKRLKEKRAMDIYIKEGISDEIEIEVVIPKGYTPIIKPEEDVNVSNEFGTIKNSITQVNESLLKVTASYIRNKGEFNPDKVQDYNAFVEALHKYTDRKLVLKPI